ncbi:Signal peptidase IB [Acaryochloris thomasi RCC1774]|uniref:Signal peptidase I n=1 Tax=Acaryochloris thomasi RCC1774 TaxID=1764569 RepID=A0A2W1JZC3_9CYAN|nr:signal peptidase I [Acaryochloris thomasi]PZD75282.1 Signal peptidase IB [Acaryochloris thomasi RCC1774]
MSKNSHQQPNSSKTQEINDTEESWWLEAIKTIGLSLFLAFGIRTFVAEARYIPSGSMEPTLQINDRLIIDKVSYDFRKPVRGDIVVFNPTQALKDQGFDDAFIKRIVGVAGDKIEIQDGTVLLNGQPLKELYVANGDDTLVDTCGGGPSGSAPAFLQNPQTIPENSYLVLGDNRHNSYDGRCWGVVADDELVGRAVFRFWPLHRLGTIPEPKVSEPGES